MRLSPLDIQHMEFGRSMSGYHRQQVREFLERIADEREEILRELQSLRDELAKKDEQIDELQSTEKELKRTVIAAERIANELKENARKEADLIVQEAEHRKRETLRSTEEQLAQSRAELERVARERKLFKEQFRGTLEAFLRTLDDLPSPPAADASDGHDLDEIAEEPSDDSVPAGEHAG